MATVQYMWTQCFAVLIVNTFLLIVTVKLLRRECSVNRNASLAPPYPRLWYMLCLLSGLLFLLLGYMDFVSGACHIALEIAPGLLSAQLIFMDYFQLSRLYECFSQTRLQTKTHAYPNWLFAFMFFVGAVLFLSISLLKALTTDAWHTYCHMNYATWTLTEQSVAAESHQSAIRNGSAAAMMYTLWDISTVLLYALRIRSFQKSAALRHDVRFQRVMSMLVRILILTLFYESMFILSVVVRALYDSTQQPWVKMAEQCIMLLSSAAVSYSIYLMQEHNTEQYLRFVDILRALKLHRLCCCCCCRDTLRMYACAHSNVNADVNLADNECSLHCGRCENVCTPQNMKEMKEIMALSSGKDRLLCVLCSACFLFQLLCLVMVLVVLISSL